MSEFRLLVRTALRVAATWNGINIGASPQHTLAQPRAAFWPGQEGQPARNLRPYRGRSLNCSLGRNPGCSDLAFTKALNTSKAQVVVWRLNLTQKINLGPLQGKEKDKEDLDSISLSLISFKALLSCIIISICTRGPEILGD